MTFPPTSLTMSRGEPVYPLASRYRLPTVEPRERERERERRGLLCGRDHTLARPVPSRYSRVQYSAENTVCVPW